MDERVFVLCEHVQGRWPGSQKNWEWYAKHCKQHHPNGFEVTAKMQLEQLAGAAPDAQIRTEEPLTPEEEEMRVF